MKKDNDRKSKKTKSKEIDWEERLFQATAILLALETKDNANVTSWQVDRCVRKAASFVSAYKRKYEVNDLHGFGIKNENINIKPYG